LAGAIFSLLLKLLVDLKKVAFNLIMHISYQLSSYYTPILIPWGWQAHPFNKDGILGAACIASEDQNAAAAAT
jgi:hypothetical protein